MLYILQKDKEYTAAKKVPPLFSCFIARPRKTALQNEALLNQYQAYENAREEKAAKRNGIYTLSAYYRFLAERFYRRKIRCRLLNFKCFIS